MTLGQIEADWGILKHFVSMFCLKQPPKKIKMNHFTCKKPCLNYLLPTGEVQCTFFVHTVYILCTSLTCLIVVMFVMC